MVNLLLFIVNLISAIIMFYSLMFAVSVISFWAFSGELYYLFNSLTAISRYPLDIFSKGVQLVLTVIPVIFIATIPAKILIGPPPLLSFAAPVIALIFFVIVRRFWFLGLRSYESASS
jgi:ABC-type uncharacterized transport system permease subunit